MLGNPADYEQPPQATIERRAAALGVDPLSLAYDLMLQDDGKTILYLPSTNCVHGNDDSVHEMMTHPDVLPSLSDGGTHYGLICDASYSTFMRTH